MEPEKKQKEGKHISFISYAIIPFVLSVPPVVGWALGTYMDGIFGTTPYLMYLFVIFGFVAAVREFLRLVKKIGE